jgi:hypothetical protein
LWGVLVGLVLRVLFFNQEASSAWSAMAGGFIWLAPLVVGAVTVYVAETTRRRSWLYYFWAPFFANALFIIGTLVILIEGLICAAIIVPLFAAMGALGGLIMGLVCRLTNWPKQTLYALAALPMALGLAGDYLPTPDTHHTITRTAHVQASPARVWQALNHASDIRAEEFGATHAAHIGVPMPLSGITEHRASGPVRVSVWAKGVQIEEPITDWQPERYLRWVYRFTPESFPKGALDDHVMIGGHYFDLKDTSFTLTPAGEGTQVEVKVHYRVSTQFNFYAVPVAKLLLGNMLETGLQFYKQRSERAS